MKLFYDFRYAVPPYPEYCQQAGIKLTQGETFVNPIALQQASAGNVLLSWHYWLGISDPKKQARNFVAAFQTITPAAIPVLDCEDPSAAVRGTTPTRIKACLDEMESLLGKPVMVYTRASWWDYKVGNQSWAKDHELWVAHYLALRPRIPAGWTGYKAWQFMGDVYMPGFLQSTGMPIKVDVNVLA